MNLVNFVMEYQKNKYNIIDIHQLIDNYRTEEQSALCQCSNYAPHIKYGSCRFCWKYGRKSDKDALKFVLKYLDNKN